MTLENLIASVNTINKDEDIAPLAKAYNLIEFPVTDKLSQVLSIYKGTLDGKSITLSHRWYDRCRPFLIQPDGNKVALEVDGVKLAEGSFLDPN